MVWEGGERKLTPYPISGPASGIKRVVATRSHEHAKASAGEHEPALFHALLRRYRSDGIGDTAERAYGEMAALLQLLRNSALHEA